MKRIISLSVAFLLFSCVRHGDDRSQSDLAIVLSPTFEQISTNPNLVEHASASRATATAFEVGDQIGLYATMAGQAIKAVGNHVNNKKFIAAADGSIAAAPVVYYPDTKAPAKLCAYYPYSASVSDATKIEFEVSEDPKASDLCYARAEALPSAEAQPLRFTHQLSRTIFTIALPTGATLQKAELQNVLSRATLDLNDGSITNGSTRKNIVLYNNSEAIVPAQTFAVGEKMLAITIETAAGAAEVYYYAPLANTTLEQGKITTFNLTLNDNRTASLASAVVVVPWTTQTLTGDVNLAPSNSFTAHWALPNAKYALATQATLTIKNLKTNLSKDYPTTNFKVKTESSSVLMCSYTFNFAPSAAELLGYPYQIEAITFKDAANNEIQACTAIMAKSVYKCGDYWLGIEAGNLLVISTTPLTNWGAENGGGSIAGGVTNDFMVTMVEPSYAYETISAIELTINGTAYSFTALTPDPTSNKLLARSSFSLPDNSPTPKVPPIYPYTVERVTLKNTSGALLYDGSCNVEVTSIGQVSLSLYYNYYTTPIPGFSNINVALVDNATANWNAATSNCVAWGGRLPTKDELLAIYNSKASYGTFNGNYYWSSTLSGSSYNAVSLHNGDVTNGNLNDDYYVRCVKEGDYYPTPLQGFPKTYVATSDNTTAIWQDATNNCASWGGRLPTKDELVAIYNNKATYGTFVLNVWYWSSTLGDNGNYVVVGFNAGGVGGLNPDNEVHVRCVKTI